jgi:hypothetical protein
MTNQSQNITEDFLDQLLDIIQGQTQQKPKREIVDIHGLATVLDVEVSTLYKTWRQYPHFFPGNGRNGKGAKFDVEDVYPAPEPTPLVFSKICVDYLELEGSHIFKHLGL